MTSALATIEAGGGTIDHAAILKSLNLNPRDANTQALLLVCERYGLDPLLKHMVLIQGNPYVTRDGYLAIAHRSGQFDGMEVVEQSETTTHHIAKVAVYRKDMGRPFTFIGRFPKGKQMAKEYGPEMAVKVAEVQALRRAFNVTGVGAADERWDDEAIPDPTPTGKALPREPSSRALPTAPLPADPATGEVRARRGPPTKAKPAPQEEPFPADDTPAEPLASDAQRAEIQSMLEMVPADRKNELIEAWRERGIANYKQAERFTGTDAARAISLLMEYVGDTSPFVEPSHA